MNKEMTELAREAVACDGWCWMEGMAAIHKDSGHSKRVLRVVDDGSGLENYGARWPMVSHLFIPDLTDPATLGCLLHLVREVAGLLVWVEYDRHGHVPVGIKPKATKGTLPAILTDAYHPTEAHALVAALKAGDSQ